MAELLETEKETLHINENLKSDLITKDTLLPKTMSEVALVNPEEKSSQIQVLLNASRFDN